MSSAPEDDFSPSHWRWLMFLTITTLIIGGLMLLLDVELRTRGAPLGMVSLQLAGGTQTAKRIVMNEWSFEHRIEAAFGLGFDFLFICSYATWLYLGCLWSANRWQGQNETRAGWIRGAAWLSVAAAGFDVVENIVLFDFIHSDGKSPAYPIAYWCALVKFLLIAIVLSAYASGLVAGSDVEETVKPVPEKKPEPAKK
jgi:hypothetical protein